MRSSRSLLFLAVATLVLSATDAIAVGALFVRPLNSQQTYEAMSIRTYDATAAIQDQIAVTHVDQVFFNSTNSRVESTFIFPLPEGAVITELIYWFNGKRYKASLREREEAQKAYDDKVRRLIDPALLQEIGGNVFKLNIAPIDPKSDVRFEITYAELLPYEFGVVDYRFMLNTTGLSPQPLERVSLKATATTGSTFRSFTSPSHGSTAASDIRQVDPSQYTATFGDENFLPDRDYVLRFSTHRTGVDLNVLTYYPTPQDSFGLHGFYALWVTAPDSTAESSTPRNIVFAADVSSSMEGKRIEQLKAALGAFVESLEPDDMFNIVLFSTGAVPYRPDLVRAVPEELSSAREFISSIGAAGLTNISDALHSSFAMTYGDTTANIVVLLTDGYPTWGQKEPAIILDSVSAWNTNGVRLFTFGIGEDVSKPLLDNLASRNGGYATYIASDNSISQVIADYFRRVTRPVFSDLTVDYGGLDTYDRYPAQLSNLFWGSQTLQFGRYRNAGTFDISVTGTLLNSTLTIHDQGTFDTIPGGNRAVARLWADQKIDFLLGQIALLGEQKELVDAIVDLSIRYGILSPYTALYSDPDEDDPQTSDVEEVMLPLQLTLRESVPNPFTTTTRITFMIPPGARAATTLQIFDVNGRLVRSLFDREAGPGEYNVMWDGRDNAGGEVPAGLYLCRLNCGEATTTTRILLVR